MSEKSYQNISLEDWDMFGGGATAESFFHKTDKGLMLKLFKEGVDETAAEREFSSAFSISAMGIRVPKALYCVKCGPRLGLVYERVTGKVSYSRLCADNPERIPEFAKAFAIEAKKLHSIECDKEIFPPRIQFLQKCVEEVDIPENYRQQLFQVLKQTEPRTTCLHGDMQMGNLIVANGTNYWIDLGDFGYGNPLIDLGVLYYFSVVGAWTPLIQDLIHLSEQNLNAFWKFFAPAYIGSNDPQKVADFEETLKPYAALFIVMALHTIGDHLPKEHLDHAFEVCLD